MSTIFIPASAPEDLPQNSVDSRDIESTLSQSTTSLDTSRASYCHREGGITACNATPARVGNTWRIESAGV